MPRLLFSLQSPLGGLLFSYAAATVITGMAILGAWVYKVSHDYPLARSHVGANSPRSGRHGSHPAEAGVRRPDHRHGRLPLGRSATTPRRPAVPLGRKYALASGLMEITYQTRGESHPPGPLHL